MVDYREQVDELLYRRMSKELKDFRDSLKKMSVEELLSDFYTYELLYKEDLLLCFEDDELDLSDDDVRCLSQQEKPLEWLYQSWCDSGVSHMDLLRDFIRDTIQHTREGSE